MKHVNRIKMKLKFIAFEGRNSTLRVQLHRWSSISKFYKQLHASSGKCWTTYNISNSHQLTSTMDWDQNSMWGAWHTTLIGKIRSLKAEILFGGHQDYENHMLRTCHSLKHSCNIQGSDTWELIILQQAD